MAPGKDSGAAEGLGGDTRNEEEDNESSDQEEFEGSSAPSHSSEEDEEISWINWYIHLKGNDFFCEVDEEYIHDDFNLTGLSGMVPFYDYALDMMLDIDIPADHLSDEQVDVVETAAEVLYGLIHARYILTTKGMQRMYEKYNNLDFGRCPRVYCQGQGLLPVGMSDLPRNYSINLFCPRCKDLYYPKSSRQANLDGAYFGTTFAHLLMMVHPQVVPSKSVQKYIPRIYGFKIHSDSLYWGNKDEELEDDTAAGAGKGSKRNSAAQLPPPPPK